ncbi:MAG TPA: carboxypeptidase-like regulatory domain-containing protein [Vicinamibacterales bacterium]|nr:carboxypeptidase-like regulatory domain-containing protein [Vicinamibacterales bacterium]
MTPAATAWTDVVLQSGRSVNVSGRVVGAAALPPATVRLVVSFFGGNTSVHLEVAHAESTRDGTFILRGVPPGMYTLQCTAGSMFGDSGVSVGDGPVEGVVVRVGNGTTLNGQIDFDQAGGIPCRSIALRSGRVDSSDRDERQGQFIEVDRSGRFRLEQVTGRQLLSFRCDGQYPLPIKAMSVNGMAVRDGVIDTTPLAEGASVRVTLGTDGVAVRGNVTTADGERCDPLVVIVRDEPDTWTPPNDFWWEAPARGGEFHLAGLSPGRYFALVEPPTRQGRRLDALYFRAAEPRGTRFSVSSGKEVRLDLKCD